MLLQTGLQNWMDGGWHWLGMAVLWYIMMLDYVRLMHSHDLTLVVLDAYGDILYRAWTNCTGACALELQHGCIQVWLECVKWRQMVHG